MKTPIVRGFALLTAVALFLQQTPATAGTATLSGSGNWSDSTKWTSIPASFAPNNGNNGENWSATVNANTVTVDAAVIIQSLSVGGGTITATNSLSTNAGLTFSSGLFFGAGTVSIGGATAWTGGTFWTSVVNLNGGLTMSGAANKNVNNTVNNTGAATWTGGTLKIGADAAGIFNNTATGTFTTDFDGLISPNFAGTFNNAGNFTKSAGAGSTTVTTAFNNTGTVNVDSGKLSLSGGGTSSGTFNIASGKALLITSTNYTMDAGTQLLGSGSLETNNASALFNGTQTHTANFLISAGGLTFNAGSNVSTSGGLTMSGGATGGAGTLSIGGATLWTGGTLGTGVVNLNGGLTMSGAANKNVDKTVNNTGAATWTAGTFHIGSNANGIFNNTATGSFTTDFDGGMTRNFTGTFNNAGTFTKSGGAGSTTTELVAFNNTGTVNVDSGKLSLSGGGTSSGTFNIASGKALLITSTNYTMDAGTQLLGSGSLETNNASALFNGTQTHTANFLISAGGLTFNAGSNVSTSGGLTMSGGATGGAGTLSIGGATLWTGGTLGTGVVNLNGGLTMSGAANKNVDKTVNNTGAATWTAGTFHIGSNANGIFNNTATGSFTTDFDGSITQNFTGTFNNAGTFSKSAGAGSTTVNPSFNNTGTVNVNSGTLTLNGTVTQHSGTTLTGGTWNVTAASAINITTGSNITTNQGSVTLDGVGSSFAKFTTALNNNQGSFTLKNNRDLTTSGAFANSGTMTVQDSTTVMTIGAGGASAYTQSGPTSVTILAGGAMIDASAFNLNGGSLQGTGTIDAPLTTSGTTTIAPGASPGTLAINGSTVLGSGNTLAMQVGGLAAGIDYDVLDVNGVLTLAGLLDVDFLNLFENSVQFSDIFTIATADSPILGSFSNVASGGIISTNTLINFEVWYGAGSIYGANNLVLTHAPEPSRALLLMLGLTGAVLRRRRS